MNNEAPDLENIPDEDIKKFMSAIPPTKASLFSLRVWEIMKTGEYTFEEISDGMLIILNTLLKAKVSKHENSRRQSPKRGQTRHET